MTRIAIAGLCLFAASYSSFAAEVKSPFDLGSGSLVGQMKADPIRNRVYFVDKTNLRLVALDTGTGKIAAATRIEGLPTPGNRSNDYRFGQMAVSIDGSKLYLASPDALKVLVFSLPDLAPLTALPVNFHPWGLALTANDRLYVSSLFLLDYWSSLREVDAHNGSVRQTFDQPDCVRCFASTLLRTNAAGTRLFAGEPDLRVEGSPGYIFEYDITGAKAVEVDEHPFNDVYMNDFAIDEQRSRIYTMNGGIYGVQLTDLSPTGTYGTVWPIGSYAAAITFLPNGTVIYGASSDPIDGRIRKYQRSNGTKLADYVVGTDGKTIMDRAMAITPNGNVAYFLSDFLGCDCGFDAYDYYVGVIGLSSLRLDNPPSNGSPADPTLTAIGFSDVEGNTDGHANAGEIVTFAPTLTNIGAQSASGVTIDVAPDANATLLSPPSQNLGSLSPGNGVTTSPFRFQLPQNLVSRSTVTVSFTAHWGSGQSKTFPYTIVTRNAAPRISALAESGFYDLVVFFDALAGDTYRLERKINLTDPDWQKIPNVSDFSATTNGPAQITDYNRPVSRGFYRLRVP